MDGERFYRKRLVAEEDGLRVTTDTFISIHETECFHFCVDKFALDFIKPLGGETVLQCARRKKRLKRIHKTASRFAFDTEKKAMDHLVFLKIKQLNHMARETVFINAFLGCDADRLIKKPLIPHTQDLVHEFLNFC